MNLGRSLANLLLVSALVANSAFAEQWTSPDGVVAVTVPNAAGFLPMDDPPDPFLVLWVSTDDSVYLGVIKAEVPPGTTLDRSSAEKAVAEETKGSIIASSTVTKSGQEFWVITAESSGHGATLQITQAIAQIGTNAYKAYVGLVGVEPSDRPEADAFLNSFGLKQTGPGAETEPPPLAELDSAPVPQAEPESNAKAGTFSLSEWIGSMGVLLAVGLVLWWFADRGGKTT